MNGLAIVLLAATSGTAAPPPTDPPELPAASICLRVEAADASGPWKMVVTNTGTEMVRFAADGRLLRLEVRPPDDANAEPRAKKGKAKKDGSVVCRAPASLRPTSVDEERAVPLPPGARYEEAIDPALFCFDKAERDALVPGATVVAKLGFAPAAAKRGHAVKVQPPYVAEPTSAKAATSPLKEIVANAFTVPNPPPRALPPAVRDANADTDPGAPKIEIAAPRWLDAEGARSLAISVTLSNAGKRPLVAHIRPENLAFDIEGPSGSSLCQMWDGPRTLVRDFFRAMPPGGRESITVLLGEVCPDHAFDLPGIYKVTARITLPDDAGRAPLRAWSGDAIAKNPTIVRLRTGSLPFYKQPPEVRTGSAAR